MIAFLAGPSVAPNRPSPAGATKEGRDSMEISCNGVSLAYPTRAGGSTTALAGVTLELGASELVCLVGPSGCGKSTLLKILAGLLEPTAGSLATRFERDEDRLPRALVFQDHCVFPWMNVLENVAFGLEFRRLATAEKHDRARAFIEQVGLSAFAASLPHELSVGMRQRVALARAFVANPQLLLMDEPFAALDALTKLVLQEELLRMWSQSRALIVYVTHDLTEAALLADRVLVMSGRPGTIRLDVAVPMPRPRDLQDRGNPEVAAVAGRLWAALEDDVRQGLAAAGAAAA
jgi:NitT/TauT family transport system ATP-binding protein